MKSKKIKKEGFMKGVVILMLSQIFIKIMGLMYRMYLTNREGFGDKGNAIYGSGFQIYALLLTISSIGVPNAVSKIVSERVAIGDHRGAHKVFKIALITFGTIGFLCSLFLFYMAKDIANNWIQIPEAEMSLTALEILAIISGTDTSIMAGGANIATTISSILCFVYLYIYYSTVKKEIAREVKDSVNYRYKGIIKIIKEILCVSIPMSLTPILSTINKNIDSVTVVRGLKNFMSESMAKAEYGILTGKVDTLVTMPMSFNIAFTTALVPSVSSAKATGEWKNAKKRIEFSILITILIGLPCSIGMIIFAQPILNLLFPNQVSGAFILQVSATSILFIVLEQTISGVLQGIGKPMVPAIALSIGVIVKFIINSVLIPVNPKEFLFGGTSGAAIATTICHMIASIIDIKIMKKYIKLEINKKDYIIKPILACIMMGICSICTYKILLSIISEKLCTIISIFVAIVVYIMSALCLKIFSKSNMYMIPFGQKLYKILQFVGIYAE